MHAVLRAAELLIVFALVPAAVRIAHLGRSKLLVLAAFTAGCLVVLWVDRTFPRRELGGLRTAREQWRGIALRSLAAAAVVAGVVLARGIPLFELPRRNPGLWVLVLCLYPFLSAWPQELVYRTFFFHRYGGLLGRRGTIVASGIAFSLLHVVFADPIAPVLTLPAGMVLAARYAQHRSLAAVWVEHALYGTAVFTLGLGRAFYRAA
jgi:membrane protease YdiL (CAAX protease family)